MPRFNPFAPVISRPCWEFVFHGLHNSQSVLNVLHYVQTAGATTVPTLDVVRAAIYDAFTPELFDILSVDYLLTKVTCQRFDIPGSVVSVSEPDENGTIAGDSFPPFVQVPVRKLTEWPGQRGRGAIRFGGIPESAANRGELSNAYRLLVADVATKLDDVLATANPTDGNLVPHILTREVVLDPLPLVTVRGTPVTGTLLPNRTSTQKSRKVRSQV